MKKSLTAFIVLSFLAGHARSETKVDFAKDVLPILEKTCVKCHGAEKQKGKLRLDSKEAAFKGGGDGPSVVPGDAEKSELFRRISLPAGHDDIMPNEGDPLTKAQIDLFRDWINQGAVWPETASTKKEVSLRPPPEASLPANFKPAPAEAGAISNVAKAGVDVRPIAQNVPWREANFRLQGTNINDASLAPLKDIASLVDLNLATTRITDSGLEHLKGLTNLLRLHLELTSVTDDGLRHLRGLTNLHYLNLYGTPVTDAGLENLKGLQRLRNLYLWQSKATEAGVTNLKTALPELAISTGWDTNILAQKEDKEEKPEEKK